MVLTPRRVGRRLTWQCGKGKSTPKMFQNIPFAQRSERVNHRHCTYYTGALYSFTLSNGVAWKSATN